MKTKLYIFILIGLIFISISYGVGNTAASAAPTAATVGLNGAACAYETIGAALDDAVDGDTIYISAGTYIESLGVVGVDVHLTAAVADCTTADATADPANHTISGTMFALEGGVVNIAANHIITFTNLTLSTGQAMQGGVLYVSSGATAVLDNSDVRDGIANAEGGLVYVAADGTLLADHATLTGSSAGNMGGGLYLLGNATFTYSTISDASAPLGGGGAVAGDGKLILNDGHWGDESSPNTADSGGGLYLIDQAQLHVFGTNIRANQANSGNGGGIYAKGPQVSIQLFDNTRIFRNEASNAGGGIYAADGVQLHLHEISMVGDNQPSTANTAMLGGGIYADGVLDFYIEEDSRVLNNKASIHGGGIMLIGGSELHMSDGLIRANNAQTGQGGGLIVVDGHAFLNNVVIQQNEAVFGGGVAQVATPSNTIAITNSQVISNTAVQHGGGLFIIATDLQWIDTDGSSRMAGNQAGQNGGASYQFGGGTLVLAADPDSAASQLLIENNSANSNGGGLYNEQGRLAVVGNTRLQNNTAVGDGGGMYLDSADLMILGEEGQRPLIAHNEALNGSGGGLYLNNVGGTLGLILNALISHNTADNDGGGVYVASNSQLQLGNALIHNNTGGNGGGLYISSSTVTMATDPATCANAQLPANQYCSELRGNDAGAGEGGAVRITFASEFVLENTAVISNTAATAGGILSDGNAAHIELTNNLFTHNSDKAFLLSNNASVELIQNTFTANEWAISITSPGTTINHNNNIIWGNDFGVSIAPLILSVGCSISQNGIIGTNIDPLFHTTLRGDYRLGVGSPAIDDCVAGTTADLDGIPRPQGANYDAGAFESGRPLILFPTMLSTAEGDAGTTAVPLLITLSEPSTQVVSVTVATVSGTALSGTDFTPFTQTISFPAGTISHTVMLAITGDNVHEGDEVFTVELSAAQNGELTAALTTITLADDDLPTLTVANGMVVEGNDDTTPLLFAITLSNPSAFTTTVDFATGWEGDTAMEGVDYQTSAGTFLMAPGQTAAHLSIRVYGDEAEEVDESFTVVLSNPQGAILATAEATGTIVDDDGIRMVFLPFIGR